MSREATAKHASAATDTSNAHIISSVPQFSLITSSSKGQISEATQASLLFETASKTTEAVSSAPITHSSSQPVAQLSYSDFSSLVPQSSPYHVCPANSVKVSDAVQHPVNGVLTQMIAPGDVYKMAPTPLFMTQSASVYPQVALIPETDLLRSMIVQDVKQVTQKLLDKNTKKKRGRRSRKEEIIPGDFGTLKVNFTKFVNKDHPPFSLADPPAPKRTVYQRIAPYPVAASEPIVAQNSEKPARKTKGTSSRSLKRVENSNINSLGNSVVDGVKETYRAGRDGSTRRISRLKKSSSCGSKSGKSIESPLNVMPNCSSDGRDPTGNLATEVAFMKNFQSHAIPLNANSSNAITTEVTSLAVTSYDQFGESAFKDMGNNPSVDTRVVTPKIVNNRLKSEENSIEQSTSKDSLIIDSNANHVEISNSQNVIDNDVNGFSYSELLGGSPIMYMANTNLDSPGLIGNELNTLLSDLYNDFPPLSPVKIDESMETVASCETVGQNTTTVSVLSQPLVSSLSSNEMQNVDSTDGGNVSQIPISDCIVEDPFTSTTTTTLNNISTELSVDEEAPLLCTNDAIMPLHRSTKNGIISEEILEYKTEVLTDSAWISSKSSAIDTTHLLSTESMIATKTQKIKNTPRNFTSSEEAVFSMDVDASQNIDGNKSRELLDIVDISPEYASAEGGGKIILIGSWNSKNARYSCRFGDVCAPGDLIQNGVLRCFCPPHAPGKVRVSVLCNDVIISKSVDFEYVDTEDLQDESQEERHDWLKISDEDLKSLLLERIEAISDIFDDGNSVPRFQGHLCNTVDLEDVLVRICESISKLQDHLPINIDYKSDRVMTVLHLSAALGFTKLIQTICNWVETNSNKIMLQEADPCKYDQFQLTPLMWACAKGKFDTVCVLLQWDESVVNQTDGCGCTPLSISRDQGHTILLRYLEKSQIKGSFSKTSSFASESGSPNLRSGRLSRSSSLSSQIENGRELQYGIDDVMFCDASRRSPGSNRISYDGSPDSCNGSSMLSRTLGQTLVHVQAIIQDGVDAHNETTRTPPLASLDLDDDSLFTPSPFNPRRLTSSTDDRHSNHTPKSLASLSPVSPAHSPGCQSPFDPTLRGTAEFCEFFYNSDRILEKDFAELTLTDEEQQNLYKAASVIQNAYKRYRERRKQRDAEMSAAVLIQSYYRRYKQYAMFKKMQRGAVVIQHKYRAHREKEKQKSHAATVIQSYYRSYKERKNLPGTSSSSVVVTSSMQEQCSAASLDRPTSLSEWRNSRAAQSQQ